MECTIFAFDEKKVEFIRIGNDISKFCYIKAANEGHNSVTISFDDRPHNLKAYQQLRHAVEELGKYLYSEAREE